MLLENACGNGAVTQAVMEVEKPGSFTINATDMNPKMCEMTATVAASKGWTDNVRTGIMPAEAFTFGNDTFTYSFSNFLIFLDNEPDKVAGSIYRTLKPGGVAIITTWAEVPYEQAILKAHTATRGPGAFHAYTTRLEWKKASHLVSVLEKAGFSNVEMVKCDAILRIENLKRWSKVAWSFPGAPMGSAGGWTKEDEDKFDEAVSIVWNELSKGEDAKVENDGSGGAEVKMVAHIAIAGKYSN
jgi:SAM-dependent methyltransferase